MKLSSLATAMALVAALAACSESPTGVNGPSAPLSLSLMVPGAGPLAGGQLFAGDMSISDGSHTLVIQSAEVVLREIEFERMEAQNGCDADEGEVEGGADDSCEEFETAPMVMPLPLDGGVAEKLEVNVPAGVYDEMEYDIHKLGDDPEDLTLLGTRPEFDQASVLVTGTWDGQAFTFTADIDVEVEMDFATPLEIVEGQTYNVTLSVDVNSWFFDGVTLTDPNSALKGQPNEELVENRIEASFEGFEDNDHDGVPHGEDSDEDGGSS